MNKIYKLIWSKTKNCWVVASELAKGHGKNKSRIKNSLLAVFVMSALLAGGTADVQALNNRKKTKSRTKLPNICLTRLPTAEKSPVRKRSMGLRVFLRRLRIVFSTMMTFRIKSARN